MFCSQLFNEKWGNQWASAPTPPLGKHRRYAYDFNGNNNIPIFIRFDPFLHYTVFTGVITLKIKSYKIGTF